MNIDNHELSRISGREVSSGPTQGFVICNSSSGQLFTAPSWHVTRNFEKMQKLRADSILCDVVLSAPARIPLMNEEFGHVLHKNNNNNNDNCNNNNNNQNNLNTEAEIGLKGGENGRKFPLPPPPSNLVEILPAHKLVLAACSDYFAAMFSHDASQVIESGQYRIVMRGLEAAILANVVDFMYSGTIELREDNVEKILATANLLQLPELVEACSEFFINRLSPFNCCGIRAFADAQSCTKLFELSEQYILDNFLEVVGNQEFTLLPFGQIVTLLRSEELNVTREESVYLAALKWIRHDTRKRKMHLAEILGIIRLCHLAPDFIQSHIQDDPLLFGDELAYHLIVDALLAMLLPNKQLNSLMGHCSHKDRLQNGSGIWEDSGASKSLSRYRGRKGTLGTVFILGGMDSNRNSPGLEAYMFRLNVWCNYSVGVPSSPGTPNPRGFLDTNYLRFQGTRITPSSSSNEGTFVNTEGTGVDNNINEILFNSTPYSAANTARLSTEILRRPTISSTRRADIGLNQLTASSYNASCYSQTLSISNSLNNNPPIETALLLRHCRDPFRSSGRRDSRRASRLNNRPSLFTAIGGPSYDASALISHPADAASTSFNKRLQFGAAFVAGKIYIIGGRDGLKTLSSVECLDVTYMSPTLKDRLNSERGTSTSLFEDGPITERTLTDMLLAPNDSYVYLTASTETCPGMITPRHGLGVAVLGGLIYAVGGHDGWSYLNTVERFDPVSRTWSYVAQLDIARSTVGVAALGNKLYAIGGRDGNNILKSVECYDLARDKWTRVASMCETRSCLGVAVAQVSAAPVSDVPPKNGFQDTMSSVTGCIYVAGGHKSSHRSSNVLSTFERYDPIDDSWALLPPMHESRDAVTLCALDASRILAVGGFDGSAYVKTVELFDAFTNEWTYVDSLNTGRAGACAVLIPPPPLDIPGNWRASSTSDDSKSCNRRHCNPKHYTNQITTLASVNNENSIENSVTHACSSSNNNNNNIYAITNHCITSNNLSTRGNRSRFRRSTPCRNPFPTSCIINTHRPTLNSAINLPVTDTVNPIDSILHNCADGSCVASNFADAVNPNREQEVAQNFHVNNLENVATSTLLHITELMDDDTIGP